ncbi:MAG: hypothetical protein HPY71_04500 [Firmicutes bacterium]|nr:hypothetical protein [Bacillota bacterium]
MIRKQVYIAPYQDVLLKQRAKELNVTEAELVRRAIELYTSSGITAYRDLRYWEKEKAFIDSLIARGHVKGGRQWRREDLYER